MKTQLKLLVLALLISAISHDPSGALAQGALTPPGPPAPTMKSLDQIEPRAPISSAPFTISASGSYYLTTNVTVSSGDAIDILTNNVTLDLNGFTISSIAASETGYAIQLGNVANISIYNGQISSGVTSAAGVFSGGGFIDGISYSGNTPYNVRVKNVSVAGVASFGITLGIGNSTIVEGCTVNIVGSIGIVADSVADSTAMNCGGYAIIAATAQNCTGSGVGNGYGLDAYTANNCYGISAGSGIGLNASDVATGCYGSSGGTGDGLDAAIANNCSGISALGNGLDASDVATGCNGSSSQGGYGLIADVAENCSGTSGGGFGLHAYDTTTSCYGYSNGNGYGILAGTANSCYGISEGNSGYGMAVETANNCYGQCDGTGIGLAANGTATGCSAVNMSGTALTAYIASVCHAIGSPAFSVTHNVNSY